jgi:hypothetical protein
VKINNLDTCCEQVGRRGKDCEMKRNETKPKYKRNKNRQAMAKDHQEWRKLVLEVKVHNGE